MKIWISILLLALVACAAPTATPPKTPVLPPIDLATCETANAAPSDQFRSDDSAALAIFSGKPRFVEFYAPGCETCIQIRPILHDLESKYGTCIDFIYLNSTLNDPGTGAVKNMLGYRGDPDLFLLTPYTKIAWTKLGAVTQPELETLLQDILKR